MNSILGISAYYHDSAACLLQDGELTAAAQEERFTRKKHDDSFPVNAIQYCLAEGKVSRSGLTAVVFYDKPIDKFVRILKTHLAVAPKGLNSFLKAVPQWSLKKLWVRFETEQTLSDLGFSTPQPIYFTEHHEAHAASAFFPSPFAEATIVTLDGVGEWPTTTIGIGRGNRIQILKEQNFPHSLGLLYSAFTYYLGFAVNSDEYKVMGLAPYGRPRFKGRIFDKLVSLNEDGSFRMNMNYFNYLGGLTMTNAAFEELFENPVRVPESEITQHTMDVASSIQEATNEIVARIAHAAVATTGVTNLCLAGGVALNCVANGNLLKTASFPSIWVAPAAGDAGGSIGAAFTVWHHIMNQPRPTSDAKDKMRGCFLGPSFTDDEVEGLLRSEGCPFTKLDRDNWARTIATLLTNGNIVGLFQGRMEFGPRALGSRSILADPRQEGIQSRLNQRIKFRESFRPFAPAVLEEYCSQYFDLSTPSPYMLFTSPVTQAHRTNDKPDDPAQSIRDRLARKRSDIPGVTHLDFSARVQTVSNETNPSLHGILSAFRELTGCAVLINTSFNVRGEPIVCTPKDAYHCFMRTRMDHLVVESYLLSKDRL